MKHILSTLLLTFLFNLCTYACFVDDPSRIVFKKQDVVITLNNAVIQYHFPLTESSSANGIIQGLWKNKTYTCDAMTSFPLTVNLQFMGFENSNSENKTNRACLLYLDKNGKWQILKQIKNVKWDIETNTGNARALFGQHVIQNSMNFKNGEILFVLCYFESNNNSTHNLTQLLTTKQTINTFTEERINQLGVIAIRVISNTKPL